MNPDLFITIVFVGIAVLAALLSLAIVLPQVRRESARVLEREPSRPSRGKAEHDAAVH